jgi:hypothetical protein
VSNAYVRNCECHRYVFATSWRRTGVPKTYVDQMTEIDGVCITTIIISRDDIYYNIAPTYIFPSGFGLARARERSARDVCQRRRPPVGVLLLVRCCSGYPIVSSSTRLYNNEISFTVIAIIKVHVLPFISVRLGEIKEGGLYLFFL